MVDVNVIFYWMWLDWSHFQSIISVQKAKAINFLYLHIHNESEQTSLKQPMPKTQSKPVDLRNTPNVEKVKYHTKY